MKGRPDVTQKVYLIPKHNTQVYNMDARNFLPPEGSEVVLTPYWRRRLNEGSVTISTPPKPEKQPKTTTKKGA